MVQSLSVFILGSNLSQFEFDWGFGQEKKFSNQANTKCLVLLRRVLPLRDFLLGLVGYFFRFFLL